MSIKLKDIEDIETITHYFDRLGYDTADDMYFNTVNFGSKKVGRIIKDYEENLINQVYASYGEGIHGTRQPKENEEGEINYTNVLGKFNPFRQDLNPGITEGRDTTFISSEIGNKKSPLGKTTSTNDLLKTLFHETMHKFDEHPEHTDEEAYEEDKNLYDELVSNIVSKGTDYPIDPTKPFSWYQEFKNALFPKKVKYLSFSRCFTNSASGQRFKISSLR